MADCNRRVPVQHHQRNGQSYEAAAADDNSPRAIDLDLVALEQLRGYMSALIGRKRRTPAQDVLSDLAVASDEQRLRFAQNGTGTATRINKSQG